jgi:WD40 repeat protein
MQASAKFFALPYESGGGGTLAVVPLTKFGRLPRDMKLITGHSGPILDFEFSPFDANMLCSCSEDMTIKIWQIPDEGLKEHLKEPLVSLEGHGKKVSFCTFNPSADGIIASAAFDLTIRIWNMHDQEEICKVDVPEQVTHLKWNYNGSLLAATCKDKKLRIIDPRAGKIISSCKIHEGVKPSKVEWLGSLSNPDECFKLVTTGFTSQAEREMAVWDTRHFPTDPDSTEEIQPLNLLVLGQGTGALFPTFDAGTQMLYVAGKGDGNVRFFEVDTEDPYLHYISDYRSTTPQKGFTFLPKRCVQPVPKHEIRRGLKLETTSVLKVTFKVPRKSEAFQEDLFPDCPAPRAAMTPDQWASGAECRPPVLMSMRNLAEGLADAASAAPSAGTGMVSVKDLKKQLADANARVAALEKENAALKEEVAKLKG